MSALERPPDEAVRHRRAMCQWPAGSHHGWFAHQSAKDWWLERSRTIASYFPAQICLFRDSRDRGQTTGTSPYSGA